VTYKDIVVRDLINFF